MELLGEVGKHLQTHQSPAFNPTPRSSPEQELLSTTVQKVMEIIPNFQWDTIPCTLPTGLRCFSSLHPLSNLRRSGISSLWFLGWSVVFSCPSLEELWNTSTWFSLVLGSWRMGLGREGGGGRTDVAFHIQFLSDSYIMGHYSRVLSSCCCCLGFFLLIMFGLAVAKFQSPVGPLTLNLLF